MGFTVHPEGNYQLCSSSSRDSLSLVKEKNLNSIWKSEQINQAREAMLRNEEVHPACSTCHNLESKGIESKRERYNKKKLAIYGEAVCGSAVFDDASNRKIIDLDISFSNLCNLNCVTCSSQYSTSWFAKDQEALDQGLDFRMYDNAKKPWKLPKELIDELIISHRDYLRQVLIKGGEPFVDPSCLYFLKELSKCLKKSPRDELSIYIQTNGTVMNKKIIESIGDLKVEIGFSVDGLGDGFKWLRGFNFNRFLDNFEATKEIKNLKNTYVHYTVSAYNFHRVAEFIEFIVTKDIWFKDLRKLTFGVAHQNHNTFLAFSKECRLKVIDEIQSVVNRLGVDLKFFDGYEPLIQELSGEKLGIESVAQFKEWLAFCNKMRKRKLEDIDPEFKLLLDNHV